MSDFSRSVTEAYCRLVIASPAANLVPIAQALAALAAPIGKIRPIVRVTVLAANMPAVITDTGTRPYHFDCIAALRSPERMHGAKAAMTAGNR
jgi:hypothetical protein